MFLLTVLDSEQTDKVHALVCIGTAKLMLAGMIADERLLLALTLAYISPETVGNHELRQCLSYFFPVYSYSSAENQRRMQRVRVLASTDLEGPDMVASARRFSSKRSRNSRQRIVAGIARKIWWPPRRPPSCLPTGQTLYRLRTSPLPRARSIS